MHLITAVKAFFAILFSKECAETWKRLTAAEEPEPSKPEAVRETELPEDAVYTLTLLQRHGRLIDFLEENIDDYGDAQVGAAVRQIHQGCRKVLDENFGIKPVREENEGEEVAIQEGFDPARIRLTGSVAGEPPFEGRLQHRGWCVTKVEFPERHNKLDPAVICPAEVEL